MKRVPILVLVGLLVSLSSHKVRAQWTQVGPCGGTVNGFAVVGNTIYAAAYGGVMVSTDNGVDWTHSNWGFMNGDVRCVAASSSKVFAGTWGGTLYSRDVNGLIWQKTSLSNEDVLCLAVIGNNIFAGTYADGVYLSTDNGGTWTQINNGLTDTQVECLAVSGTILFAGTGSAVFMTTDNGANWKEASNGLPNNTVLSLAVNGTNLYSGVWGSAPFTSPNNGDGWLQFGGSFPGSPYISSWAFSGSKVYVGTDWVYMTSDGGLSWTELSGDNCPYDVNTLAIIGPNLVAGTRDSSIYVSSNGGSNWTHVTWGLPNYCTNGISASNGNILAAGTVGMLLSTDEGASWTTTTMHGDYDWADFQTVAYRSSVYAFAGDVNGIAYVSSDGGQNWDEGGQVEDSVSISAFAFISTYVFAATQPHAAGVPGGVYMSKDNGATWTSVSTGLPTLADTNTVVSSLAVVGSKLFAGTGHGVYMSSNNGTSWTRVSNGLTSSFVYSLAVKGNDLFAGTDDGVFQSNDNGTSWTEAGTGLAGQALIDYPIYPGSSGDMLDRAFYITAYPGTTLSRVTLYFSATTSDAYTIQLQALNSAFNGSLIGQATTSFSSSTGSNDFKAATFDFNNATVTKGEVVAFKLSLVSGGSGTVYFCNHGNTGTASPIVQETENSTPPLSTPRFGAIAIRVDSGSYTKVLSLGVSDTNIFAGTQDEGVYVLANSNSNWRLTGLPGVCVTSFTANNGALYASTSMNGVWERLIADLLTGTKTKTNDTPKGFVLLQNYPNPFNPSTTIKYQLPMISHVTLKVYDMLGREVRTLVDGRQNAGMYSVRFDGSRLASGVYFYRITAGTYLQTKKLVLIK